MDTLGCINGGGEDEGGAEDGELHCSVHPPHPFQAHFVGQSREFLSQKFLQQTAPVAARKRGSMLSGIQSARSWARAGTNSAVAELIQTNESPNHESPESIFNGAPIINKEKLNE